MSTIESQYPFSQTIYYMVQLRNELVALLRTCAVSEEPALKFSLFSSKKSFRKDELHLGLRPLNPFCKFSEN